MGPEYERTRTFELSISIPCEFREDVARNMRQCQKIILCINEMQRGALTIQINSINNIECHDMALAKLFSNAIAHSNILKLNSRN